uniref:Uncharacterized protein n=1 Tax=Vibrio tasmaniensis TaxID=212663 RepID=A0A0H3ZL47_9VIBR|nr:hypothetical protein [Vibrio tasmaniensis]
MAGCGECYPFESEQLTAPVKFSGPVNLGGRLGVSLALRALLISAMLCPASSPTTS